MSGARQLAPDRRPRRRQRGVVARQSASRSGGRTEESRAEALDLSPLLCALVERMAGGWIAFDGTGRVVHRSRPSPGGGGTKSVSLSPAAVRRLFRRTAGMRPGSTDTFLLSWIEGGRRLRVRVDAAAAEAPGAAGGRLVFCALRRARPTRGQSTGEWCRVRGRPAGSLNAGPGREPLVAAAPEWMEPLGGPGRPIELDVRVDPELSPSEADRRLLASVWREAGAAAVDSMPEGGTLSVRLRRAMGAGGEESFRLVIRDTGRGIDRAAVGRVLQGDSRVLSDRVEDRLRAVRALAEARRGRMHLVSAPACGTSVVVEVPLDGSGANRPAAEAA